MEITKIKVGGFRNISNVELFFNHNITSLVGCNGYGKSNVMDAISFGFEFISLPKQLHINRMSTKNNIPLLASIAGKNFSFEFEVKLNSKGKDYFAYYGLEFSWKTNNTQAKIIKEFLKIKETEKGNKYKSFIVRNENEAKYLSSEKGRCDKLIKIENDGLVLTKIMALDDLFYLDIINQLNNVQYYIEKHLDAGSSYDPDPFIIKGIDELELDGISSIPRAIYYLQKEYKEKYKLLINAFKQLFPSIKDVSIKELRTVKKVDLPDNVPFVFDDSVYVMIVNDKKLIQPIRFEYLSDGTKRLFLMLTFAIIADIKEFSMIAIEEPENSIHPSLFQSFLDVLSQITKKCKIIITSHSPYIVQYLNPNSIYIGLPSENGESCFRRIAASKVKSLLIDAMQYDMSVGDYIFSILSEQDALDYLKDYVESYV